MKALSPLFIALCAALSAHANAAQIVINGGAGSATFGHRIYLLPNGNIVVVDPDYDHPSPAVANCGAVYLIRADGLGISKLRGNNANDQLGSGGVTVLANGNFVVQSPNVDSGAIQNVGAATFVDGFLGLEGTLSTSNSLMGSLANDFVGNNVVALANGNYVVASTSWNSPARTDAGAVTFGNGKSGVRGLVSASNSVVGSNNDDQVGQAVTALSNGNFVISSPNWDNNSISNAGAVTFSSGTLVGALSASNSLVGSRTNDFVGQVHPLRSGDYVVTASNWDSADSVDVGAAVFASGTTGVTGTISSLNALIGQFGNDAVGGNGIVELTNGNYVVVSPNFSSQMGAVTLASAISGRTGVVSIANSLVGRAQGDSIGLRLNLPNDPFHPSVVPLANGNYVISSRLFNGSPGAPDGAVDIGAVTWASGTTPTVGVVNESNSLAGSATGDRIGGQIVPLANGNYVIMSWEWNGAGDDRGAATFALGTAARTGTISASNSLIGAADFDRVGEGGATLLANGNYVVLSPQVMNDSGAATFGLATSGVSGVVSSTNSLMGANANASAINAVALSNGNYVVTQNSVTFASGTTGLSGTINAANSWLSDATNFLPQVPVQALPGGRYLIQAPSLDLNFKADVGAVHVVSGTAPFLGGVNASNALVGSLDNDRFGLEANVQSNGKVVVLSYVYDGNGTVDSGAVTLMKADGSDVGTLNDTNSVFGLVQNGTFSEYEYDSTRNQLFVGQPLSNRIVILRPGTPTSTSAVQTSPNPSDDGQQVTFSATVTSTPRVSEGRMLFTTSAGDSCTDSSLEIVDASTVRFSCSMILSTPGLMATAGEYMGSENFGYSHSPLGFHNYTSSILFRNGFE